MDKRQLILKSGLSLREIISLRKKYLEFKGKAYRKEEKIKDIESFSDYIAFVSRLCWKGMYMITFFSLSFAIYDYYIYEEIVSAMKVFLLLYAIMLVCVLKNNGDYFHIKIGTTFKLIILRVMLVFNK
ncbi:hypothetical protein Dd586_3415 [Dickeya parazeae Ech586]|uniref:Uncharacterized protein n=1 Tax=Dickeya zeae (strain Ech586) TaxID=590409 RepID=D2BVW3_DICZ5|nr:hypothetical protein [Dickeya parazeae]ACZ78247.1 hypothetical protein Dd586_3415 [Dickeya parazeae Ech586]